VNPHEIFAELDRLQITIWYQQLGPDQDPDEREELWKESLRTHNVRRSEVNRLARVPPGPGRASDARRGPADSSKLFLTA
jgi:hypothetical protein